MFSFLTRFVLRLCNHSRQQGERSNVNARHKQVEQGGCWLTLQAAGAQVPLAAAQRSVHAMAALKDARKGTTNVLNSQSVCDHGGNRRG